MGDGVVVAAMFFYDDSYHGDRFCQLRVVFSPTDNDNSNSDGEKYQEKSLLGNGHIYYIGIHT
jgi:hypothetical protein